MLVGDEEWHRQVKALMYRIQQQDSLALSMLYQLTSAKLFGLIYRIVKEEAEAEDVLQEVFLKIWLNASKFSGKGSAWAWLCVMSRNSSLDRWRKIQQHPHISTEDSSDLLDLLVEENDLSDHIAMNRCLYSLKEQARNCILKSYLYGHSHSDLAKAMSVPLGTMKAWVRRGLKELKECLES
ncbi:RNA polymerase sigma factor [Marinomonas sp. IMCC 4694]|uniref:RNA polymerase sigma factor n=1 Tax=Marinomonas sp. IMCC 4694 TaxID=2605432 RepID=UPI0016531222|nr:sigma-70 family RNA polymerase sigma factor [Marinomonas sp. IMCC 4694]